MQRLWPHTQTAWMILAALLAIAGALLLPARVRGTTCELCLAGQAPGAAART
jgi:hypothetical protein